MDWLVDWYIFVLHLLLWFKSKSLDFDNERETFHHGGGKRVDSILSLVVCNSAKPKLDQKFYFTICEGLTFHSLLFNCWKFTRSLFLVENSAECGENAEQKNSEYGHTSCSEKSETYKETYFPEDLHIVDSEQIRACVRVMVVHEVN